MFEQRNETGQQFTVLSGSAAATDWAATGGTGPGQRFAAATNIRASIPDEYAKAASEGQTLGDEVFDEYWWETSLSHMARSATKARTRSTRVDLQPRPSRAKVQAPSWEGPLRKQLRRTRKALASRYYQLLSGHAAIGTYLHYKIHKTDTDECWWCDSGEPQSRHRLFTRCRVG